jgi:hypothetical protein
LAVFLNQNKISPPPFFFFIFVTFQIMSSEPPSFSLVDPDSMYPLVAAATKQPRNREKIRLEPGHSPLDWAKLVSSGKDLRASIYSLEKSIG